MRRRGFTLTELLIVIGIITVLAAVLFPIFQYAREKACQHTCISNQQQIAMAVLMAAQDGEGTFPATGIFWQDLQMKRDLLLCPSDKNTDGNSYVLNNQLADAHTSDFSNPQETMVSADGDHHGLPNDGTYTDFAYSASDLVARHHGSYIASYLDGHVDMARKAPSLFQLPAADDAVLWLSAGAGVQQDSVTGLLASWKDQSKNGYAVTPDDHIQSPVLVDSVPSLGGNPALWFDPQPGQGANLLHTPDISANWTSGEGTIFVVFQPTEDSEYSILDQDNGDNNQASRTKDNNGNGNSSATGQWSGASLLFASGNAGKSNSSSSSPAKSYVMTPNGVDKPTVTLMASATQVAAGTQVTLTWTSTFADKGVKSSNFGATDVNGTTVVTVNATTTFTITVQGNGLASDSVTVTVVPAPTITLSANPTSIVSGSSSTLTWSSTNATTVVSSNFGAAGVSGSKSVSPTSTTTYTITLSGIGGQSTASVTVTVLQQPTVTLTANPTSIIAGNSSALTWSSTNATTVVSSNFGAASISGLKTVTPVGATTYTITVSGPGGQATASATVTVNAVTTVTLTANPTSIISGNSSTLTWSSPNATSVVSSNFGAAGVSGSTAVSPTSTTTYTITVNGPGGQATASATVTVTQPAPTITLSATPSSIINGNSTTLAWSSTNATSVVSSNFGAATVSGNGAKSPTSTTTYTITVSGPGGQATASVTITVTQPPPTVSLLANPTSIVSGNGTTLTWSSTNATAVVSSNFSATGVSGSKSVSPTSTTTYTIIVSGPGGQSTANATVTVTQPAPTITLTASSTTIISGNTVSLNWSATDATAVVSSNFSAATVSGAKNVSPTSDTTYTITVSGPGGQATASVTITVLKPAPTLSLTANPVTIKQGNNSTLTWSSTNATSIVSSTFGASGVNGSLTVSPSATTTYSITVSGAGGQASASVTVTVNQPQPTIMLSATPSTVTLGNSTVLNWTSTHATSITSNFGASLLSGMKGVLPAGTTTYTVTASGPGGQVSASVTVTVTDESALTSDIILQLKGSPNSINEGGTCSLKWQSSNATQVVSSNFGATGTAGMLTLTPTATTTYTITVANAAKQTTASCTITVKPKALTLSISAKPKKVQAGEQAQLSWSSNGDIVVSSNFQAGATTGSLTVTPMATTTYTIMVSKGGQQMTASATVEVVITTGAQPTGNGGGMISWFRKKSVKQYPPTMSGGQPVCLSIVSSQVFYRAFINGSPMSPYAGGADWLAPDILWIGGSRHGSNAHRRSFKGYIAEIIVYKRALSDADRQKVERYLMTKYRLSH